MYKVSRASHLNLPSLATILFAAFFLLGSGAMAPAWALGPDNTNCEAGNVVVSPTTDGPADLPTHCVNTSLANTPSPGAVIPVPAGGSLKAAYNAAACGQTLLLAHGATWKGPFQFTPKGCDDQHWITIMSDGSLPGPGVRVDPSYAGEMAGISYKPGAARTNVSGDHIRFIGIEWLKLPGHALVDMVGVPGGTKVIFDRNYAHGNPGEETRRFLNMSEGNAIAVVETYMADFHCLAGGTCTDAQAISGGHGSTPNGNYKIVNNFIEGGTENILFGGSAATVTPCDIEIRNNYFYKPLPWNPSDPSYGGTKYVVKNLLELKNACRVWIEGNVFANNWGGFTQRGWALVIGPKNQGLKDGSVCPLCFVKDVVVRYNWIATAAGIFAIGTAPNSMGGGWAASGGNYSIHDDVAENLQYDTCYVCGHNLSEFSSGYSPSDPPPSADVLKNVAIRHLTIVSTAAWPSGIQDETAMMEMGGPPADNPTNTPQMSDITYEDSISGAGSNGFYSTGGGSDNCVVGEKTLADIIAACWAGGSLFSGNVLVAYTGNKTPWPTGNMTASSWGAVGFVDYNGGSGGNYALAPGSPFKGQALDGTDPGANVSLVLQYTQNSISGNPCGEPAVPCPWEPIGGQ